MIAGFIKFALGGWSWLGGIVGAVGEWLRKDHDWSLIFVFALSATCFLFVNMWLGERKARESDAREAKLTLQVCEARSILVTQEIESIKAEAEQNATRIKHEREQSAKALDDARKAQEVSEAAAEKYRRLYQERPKTCNQALKAMEASCPSLRDY